MRMSLGVTSFSMQIVWNYKRKICGKCDWLILSKCDILICMVIGWYFWRLV